MRFSSTRGFVVLLSAVSLVALAAPAVARAQTDAPAPLPALPATAPPSAEPAPPPPPTTPPPPPPVETSSPSAASEPVILAVPRYRHEGFYFGVGGGAGFMTAQGSGPLGDASITGSGSVANTGIGGTVAPGLVLGGMLRAWLETGKFEGGPPITATATYYANGVRSPPTPLTLTGNTRVATLELGAMLDWYPNPEKGWHVGGSVGLARMLLTDDAGTQSTATGVAGSIFGGYQWWLGPSWSLGLGAVLSVAGVSHLDDSNQDNTGYKLTPFGFGLESQLLYY